MGRDRGRGRKDVDGVGWGLRAKRVGRGGRRGGCNVIPRRKKSEAEPLMNRRGRQRKGRGKGSGRGRKEGRGE